MRCGEQQDLTDNRGAFHLVGVAQTPLVAVHASAPGYRDGGDLLRIGDDPHVRHDLLLAPVVTLDCVCVDADEGTPLAGCRAIEALVTDLAAFPQTEASDTSDVHGRLRLAAGAGTSFWYTFVLESYAPTRWTWKVDAIPAVPIGIPMRRTLVVTGHVVDDRHAPVPDASVELPLDLLDRRFAGDLLARVHAVGSLSYGSPAPRAHTEDDGAFRLALVAAASPWSLTASKDGYDRVTTEVRVERGALPPPLEIVLARFAVIHGRVLRNGAPMLGGTVG